jgi:transposase
MSLARLVVTAVRIEGRTKAEVAREYGVSPRWVYELCRRFDAEGETGLEPRSRRPHRSPARTPDEIEDEIVELRKALTDEGLDAGAHTIAYHLSRGHQKSPSVATIWRVLSRRGFVTPQPKKRPKSSLHPVRGRPAERALAGRHHALGDRGGAKPRDLEHPR